MKPFASYYLLSLVFSVAAPNRSIPTSYLSSEPGDITIGFVLPIHSGSSDQKNDYDDATSCGKFEPSRAMLVSQFRRSIDAINSQTILPSGLKLGYWILDSCSTSASVLLRVVNSWLNSKAGTPGLADPSVRDRLPALVVGSYKSSTSALLTQVFQQFDIPMIDFAATSPDLSDRKRYPLYARTSSSDVYQTAAISEVVSSYGWSCVHLVYSRGTYGDHGADELKAQLRRKDVCIGTEADIETGSFNFERAQLFNVVERFREQPDITVVICFCEETTVRSLLTTLWNKKQTEFDYHGSKNDFIVIGSDYWGSKMDLNGLESVADGAITFSLTAVGDPGEFGEWFTNASTIESLQADPDPWYRRYSELILRCDDLPCEITDLRRQRLKSSLAMVEDVTGLLNVSVYAAAFGLRDFLNRAPVACTKGLAAGSSAGCGWDSHGGAKQLYAAIEQTTFKMWDGISYFRFDENNDGYEASYDINQFSRYTGYAKIGVWSLDRGLYLDVETNDYGQPVMHWPSSDQAVLVTSNCSCSLNATGAINTFRTRRPPIVTRPSPLPCNNETVFWSMYGLVAEQLKNCKCNETAEPPEKKKRGKMMPIVIGLSTGLGLVVLFVISAALIIGLRRLGTWRKVAAVAKKPKPAIPVRVLPPSFVALSQFGNSESYHPAYPVENGTLSPHSTRADSDIIMMAARTPSPRLGMASLGYQDSNLDLVSFSNSRLRLSPANINGVSMSSRPSMASIRPSKPITVPNRVSNASSGSSMSAAHNIRSRGSSPQGFDSFFHSPSASGSRASTFYSILTSSRDSQELVAMVERWKIAPSRLTFGEQLGQGRFGIVYRGTLRQEYSIRPLEVAIKGLKLLSTDAVVQFLQEGFIMQGFDHPNILKLIGISIIDDQPHIVVPYQPGGNLRDYLSSVEELQMGEASALRELLDYCVQICSGMEYLARNKCIHRDLACRNILVGEATLMKIADFGLAKDLFETDYYSPSTLHRPLPVRWHPPESLRLHRFEERSDVWSYGVVCWEIFSFGQQPYTSLSNAQVFDFILSGNRLTRPEHCPDDVYREVMLKCWDEYRSMRPSFSELLQTLSQLSSQAPFAKPDETSDAPVPHYYQEPVVVVNNGPPDAGPESDSSSHYSQFAGLATTSDKAVQLESTMISQQVGAE